MYTSCVWACHLCTIDILLQRIILDVDISYIQDIKDHHITTVFKHLIYKLVMISSISIAGIGFAEEKEDSGNGDDADDRVVNDEGSICSYGR